MNLFGVDIPEALLFPVGIFAFIVFFGGLMAAGAPRARRRY